MFFRQSFKACKTFKTRKSQDDPVKQIHFFPGLEDADKAPVDKEGEECHGDEDDGKVVDNVVDSSVGAIILDEPGMKLPVSLIRLKVLEISMLHTYYKSFLLMTRVSVRATYKVSHNYWLSWDTFNIQLGSGGS